MYYIYEGAVPEARAESEDCTTVQAPQGALNGHTFGPIVTGLSIKMGVQSYYWSPLLLVAMHIKYNTKQQSRTEFVCLVLPEILISWCQ